MSGAPDFADLARAARARLAGAAGDAGGATELCELLVLWLDGDPYALPVERVREIVRVRPITPVPRVPDAVLGVISLRGEIVQVIDLRRRLALPAAEEGIVRRRRIVVLHGADGQMAGLLVDRVSEVLRIRADAFHPPTARDADAVSALVPEGERFVSLFDVERLLELGKRGDWSPAS
jgi:purine-binding chemotaxis protein CheW